MTSQPTKSTRSRSTLPRIMNALLWLVFCAMAGTGLLLALRLPPGSRGGQGLLAAGLSRHEWGDIHTWLSYALLALLVVHLIHHWRWFWQVAAKKRSWPLVLGIGMGLALLLALVLQPVETKARGRDEVGKGQGQGQGQGQGHRARNR